MVKPTISKPRRTYAPRKPRVKMPTAKSKNFKSAVVSVMNSELETKKRSVILGGATDTVPINIKASGLADSAYGAHVGNVFGFNQLTIDQGTSQNQRIGRKIENCTLWFKGCIQATFHNESTNTNQFPFDVYMIVYKDKLAPNTNVPDNLKMNDAGKGVKITGTPLNFMLPWNKSRYVIYSNKRIARFKPMPIDRPEVIDTTLQNPTIGSSDNVAFKYYNCKLPCPKTLEFKASDNSGASNQVSNAHLGIGFYVINGSGAALGASQIRATIFPSATLYFKDA